MTKPHPISFPIPDGEAARLEALRALDVLDTAPEEQFDRVTRLASQILDAPIALVSLVDEARQWFKSRVGLDATETPREVAFCTHAIMDDEVLVVPDATEDERFRRNPLVVGAPEIRFYAGAPLILSDHVRLGTLCVIDRRARTFSDEQAACLADLASIVVDELELRKRVVELAEANAAIESSAAALADANARLEQFAHMASHDLRAPAKSIINLVDIALSVPEGDARPLMEEVRASAMTMERLVAGYRRLAKLELHDDQIEAVLLRDLLHGAGEDVDVAIEGDARVHCDRALMAQVFANLAQNARAHGTPGSLALSCTVDGEEVVIVARNGVAEDVAVAESVFMPFRRLTSKVDGTGLGLAIVDRIVRLHRGRAQASCRDGIFEVTLRWPHGDGVNRTRQ